MTDEKTPDPFGPDRSAFLPQWPKGQPFQGIVLSYRIVPDVEGLQGARDVPLFRLVTDSGEPFELWGSGMLSRVLPEHVKHRVRIEDKGLDAQEDGTQLRVFDVRCATCTASEAAATAAG
jgi:hypothetical protein